MAPEHFALMPLERAHLPFVYFDASRFYRTSSSRSEVVSTKLRSFTADASDEDPPWNNTLGWFHNSAERNDPPAGRVPGGPYGVHRNPHGDPIVLPIKTSSVSYDPTLHLNELPFSLRMDYISSTLASTLEVQKPPRSIPVDCEEISIG